MQPCADSSKLPARPGGLLGSALHMPLQGPTCASSCLQSPWRSYHPQSCACPAPSTGSCSARGPSPPAVRPLLPAGGPAATALPAPVTALQKVRLMPPSGQSG